MRIYNSENKILKSFDNENWELVKEVKPFTTLTFDIRLQFNDELRPEFYKIVLVNGFGEVESEVIKVDYKRIDIIEMFTYSLEDIKQTVLNIFK